VAASGRQAKRSDGKLPPHVMAYFVMAMALFADDDYEEVGARLARANSTFSCPFMNLIERFPRIPRLRSDMS